MANNVMRLKLEVEDCRAIKSASIEVSGLTVVCGSNGVGKSTLSRVLQDALEVLLFFKGSLRFVTWRNLFLEWLHPLVNLLNYLGIKLPANDPMVKVFHLESDRRMEVEEWDEYYLEVKQSLRKVFSAQEWRSLSPNDRYVINFCNSVGVDRVDASAIESRLSNKVEEAVIASREASIKSLTYEDFCVSINSKVLWEGEVHLYEGDELILHYNGKKSLVDKSVESIKNVFYIQSPMVSIPRYGFGGIIFADNLCTFPIGGTHVPKSTSDEFMAEFAKLVLGDVVLGKDQLGNPQWRYVREDGKSFPLEMCASGFKSFSILSTLYKYNYLDHNTLLIIDEPEAHLHPEWIVEYAAMIVRLVKKCGVRVLVASHNPDMVNSIKTFAMASGISDRTKFYQAVPAGDEYPYQYNFEDQGLSIENAFDSFNKVYDAIAAKANSLKV